MEHSFSRKNINVDMGAILHCPVRYKLEDSDLIVFQFFCCQLYLPILKLAQIFYVLFFIQPATLLNCAQVLLFL